MPNPIPSLRFPVSIFHFPFSIFQFRVSSLQFPLWQVPDFGHGFDYYRRFLSSERQFILIPDRIASQVWGIGPLFCDFLSDVGAHTMKNGVGPKIAYVAVDESVDSGFG